MQHVDHGNDAKKAEATRIRVEIPNMTEEEAVRVAQILKDHPELAQELINIGAAFLEHKGQKVSKDVKFRSMSVVRNDTSRKPKPSCEWF
jgi:hypothetical protein